MLKTHRKTNLPKGSIVLFPDGNMLCAVHGDFENLQESPAGFGEGVLAALQSLRDDLDAERKEIGTRIFQVDQAMDALYREQGVSEMMIHCKRASREVATWPEWRRNILSDSGKPSVATPRKPVDNTGDDGGF